MPSFKARALRKNPTDAERALWKHLRLRQAGGHKFRRQQPIGPYVVDFVCLEKRLIIEVDGGQHSDQAAYDTERDAWLRSQGFQVLRLWDNDVLRNIESAKDAIAVALGLDAPHLNPPPQGGRR